MSSVLPHLPPFPHVLSFPKITKKCGESNYRTEWGVWCEWEKSVNFWHARSVKCRPPFCFYYQLPPAVTDTRVSKPRVRVPSRRRRVESERRDLFIFFFSPFPRSCSGGNGPAAPASSAVKSHPLLNRAPSSGQAGIDTRTRERARAVSYIKNNMARAPRHNGPAEEQQQQQQQEQQLSVWRRP